MRYSVGDCYFFFQAEDGIRDKLVTGVQTCALPIYDPQRLHLRSRRSRHRGAVRAAAAGVGDGHRRGAELRRAAPYGGGRGARRPDGLPRVQGDAATCTLIHSAGPLGAPLWWPSGFTSTVKPGLRSAIVPFTFGCRSRLRSNQIFVRSVIFAFTIPTALATEQICSPALTD